MKIFLGDVKSVPVTNKQASTQLLNMSQKKKGGGHIQHFAIASPELIVNEQLFLQIEIKTGQNLDIGQIHFDPAKIF